jgi:hypothetical protein
VLLHREEVDVITGRSPGCDSLAAIKERKVLSISRDLVPVDEKEKASG